MRIIQLRNSDEVVLVDDADYDEMSQYKWYLNVSASGNKYARTQINGKNKRMHNLIAGPKLDHKDNNGLNNQRNNLRPATKSENAANIGIKANNSSGFKGVSHYFGRWKAQIQQAGRKTYLGLYPTREEAAIAYDKRAIELYGEFACTNRSLGLLS